MRLMKFGKALMMCALSAAIMLGVTSCVQSYTVGYLYVTGTNTAATTSNGIISGFKIDHNKGGLRPINGLPVSSGGANPGRMVLLSGGRFVYVLNRGKNTAGTADCSASDPCVGANIQLFSVGGNGVLAPQGPAYFTQGFNPIRIIPDSSNSFLFVLDRDSSYNNLPASATNPNPNCGLALGAGVTTCGDITVFKIDQDTGRLTLVLNAQISSSSGQPLAYFPVPANPIDFLLNASNLLTVSGTPVTGDSVFPYTSGSNGQLTVNQNSSQPLNMGNATAIVSAHALIYVLDNETVSCNSSTGSPTTAPSGIFPFNAGSNGALSPAQGGTICGDSILTNPVYLIPENKQKWMYVAYQGSNNTTTGNADSGIAGWVIDPQSGRLEPEITGSPWGSGAGPQCLLEDPSFQFIYTANFKDSTITGRALDVQSGVLNNLPGNANRNYPLDGPAAWCVVTGRTS